MSLPIYFAPNTHPTSTPLGVQHANANGYDDANGYDAHVIGHGNGTSGGFVVVEVQCVVA